MISTNTVLWESGVYNWTVPNDIHEHCAMRIRWDQRSFCLINIKRKEHCTPISFWALSTSCVNILLWWQSGCLWVLVTLKAFILREKGRDLTQFYDKSPYTSRNVKRAKWQHKQRHKKSSITQRLRTDLGRSVWVTTATQLVWLTLFTGPPSHSPQQPCN